MSIVRLARPEIRALKRYSAALQVDDTIRLNANEAPWKNRNDNFRRGLNRYPENRPSRLTAELAARYGCGTENLLVTRGTSEAIDLLVRVFCRAGIDSIAAPAPTFSMYAHYAAVQGASLLECKTSRDQGFALDTGRLLALCTDNTRLIFICSPNNPTGNLVPRDDLLQVLEARRNQSAVVVDEAYIEFADVPSIVELLDEHDNLIVLRTLSKALAYAGARCGSVIAAKGVIEMLDAVQAPYAMATPVVESVENALLNEGLQDAERWVRDIIAARRQLMAAIERFSFVRRVWPSAANFFLVEVDDGAALSEHCAQQGVLVRFFGGELEDCVRITVGSADENERLLAAFSKLEDS